MKIGSIARSGLFGAIVALLHATSQPAQACEPAFPANFLYEETYSFDEAQFPSGLSVIASPPAWVEEEGWVGYFELVNEGPDDLYLLYRTQLTDTVATMPAGQRVDSQIWSRALPLHPDDTLSILGESAMLQFAADLTPFNVNDVDGTAPTPPSDPLPDQDGRLFVVSGQRLFIVPFNVTYSPNPSYDPEGTFKPRTLAQKVDEAPLIVLGVAQRDAGENGQAATSIQVERWLKGRGPATIEVFGFGDTSCDYQIMAGARRVFFLSTQDGHYSLNGFQAGLSDALTQPADADAIAALTGQSWAPDPPAGPTPTTISSPVPIDWRWLGLGLLALLALIILRLWRRMTFVTNSK